MLARPESTGSIEHVPGQLEVAELSRLQTALGYCRDLGRNALNGIATSRAVRGALALGLAVSAGTAIGTGLELTDPNPRPAAADTGDYPNADATELNIATYDWWVDENANGVYNAGETNSSRGYGYRNCTDWVAWRIPALGVGSVPTGLGNAKTWDDNAPAAWTKDGVPEPGDIAQSDAGDYGHIGVVEAVNRDANGAITSIDVSDYNRAGTGIYDTKNYAAAGGVFWRDTAHTKRWDNFLDLNGTGKGINNETWPPASSSPDTDQDGVIDSQDSCPTVAGSPAYGGCPPPKTTTVGVYDPTAAVFHLRDSNTPGPAGVSVNFGNSNWMPLSGDWDNNGTFTPGAYDPATGMFYLRNSHTSGGADTAFQYGNIGWKPIAGDWDGNGYWSVGLYDPGTGTFYLKNFNGGGAADLTFNFGNGNWIPIAGDWDGTDDGNAQTTIGVYDPATGMFYLNNENDSGAADKSFQYGNIGWTPIAGDWNGNKFWSIGLYDPASSTFYVRDSNDAGGADVTVQYGNAGWKPVVGDWNGGA